MAIIDSMILSFLEKKNSHFTRFRLWDGHKWDERNNPEVKKFSEGDFDVILNAGTSQDLPTPHSLSAQVAMDIRQLAGSTVMRRVHQEKNLIRPNCGTPAGPATSHPSAAASSQP